MGTLKCPIQEDPGWWQKVSLIIEGILPSLKDSTSSMAQPQDSDKPSVNTVVLESTRTRSALGNILEKNE